MKTFDEITHQLKMCEFECEAGPLRLNQAFVDLMNKIKNLPKHNIGDQVWFHVRAEVNGITLEQYVHFRVCGIQAKERNQTGTIEFLYDLTESRLTNSSEINVCFTAMTAGLLFAHNPDVDSKPPKGMKNDG